MTDNLSRPKNGRQRKGTPEDGMTPEDMGALTVFFTTADSVTDQTWNVDGGFML
jgi:hypothetical protein